LGQLSTLEKLDLTHLERLTYMPKLLRLPNLTTLTLEQCYELLSLPEMDALGELQSLNLRECNKLTCLPQSLTTLANLRELDLRNHDPLKFPVPNSTAANLRVLTGPIPFELATDH
jgi:Leucine-rich repeat (LRR) protein